jgi:4-amino-4-deoxy-L-arabinose transferase-like glycosyltransferase
VRATLSRLLAHPRSAQWIVGLGVLLRVATLLILRAQPLHDDALDYHETALQLGSGAPFEPDWPPGLAYYLWWFYRLLGSDIAVGRAAMLLIYIAFSALLYLLVRRFADHRAGSLALLLFAVMPSHILLSVTPLTQLPTAMLLVGAVLTAELCLARATLLRAIACGLCLAGLILVRPSNVVLCLVVPLYLVWRTRKLATLIAPTVVLVLLVGAWTAKVHGMTGRYLFINNANSQNMFYGNNPWTPLYRTWWFGSHKEGQPDVPPEFVAEHTRLAHSPKAERDKAFSKAAMDHIKARPGLFVIRSLSRVRTYFAFDTFTGAQLAKKGQHKLLGLGAIGADAAIYLVIMALGIVFACTAQPWPLTLLLVAFLYSGPYWASFSHPTYHFPIVPLFAALACAQAVRWLEGERLIPSGLSRRRRAILWTALVLLAGIQVEWAINMAGRV